jgi:ribosome biogenesis GTPase / thiamine phosphate phosphatase
LKAIVIKSTGSWYKLRLENGEVIDARIKGKIRLKELNVTNPIAVGDFVEYEQEQTGDDCDAVINKVLPRHNYIIRKSNKLSKQGQIIASNVDLVLMIITLSSPKTSLGFIDRFLVMAGAYHVPVTLVFNKYDLYTDEEKDYCLFLEKLYQSLGYNTVKTSINVMDLNPEKVLMPIISDKKVLISGHSGVGKSTIINAILPDVKQRTDIISVMHARGKHTTTFAEMFYINNTTAIIDTPGIRDFGIIDIDKTEIGHYFPEIRELMKHCKFNNCIHLNEPDCAVIHAYEAGTMPASRYYNYLSILENNDVFD